MRQILIVEDEKPITDLYTSLLTHNFPDCNITVAHDRASAEKALGDGSPDLVILDIELTKHDQTAGIGLINIINKFHACPVLVVSGAPVYRATMMELEAWDFLQKPVDSASFLAIVRHIIRQSPAPASARGGKRGASENLLKGFEWKGIKLNLPITSLRILSHILEQNGALVSKAELYQYLPSGRNDGNLRGHIQVIRDAFREVDANFDSLVTIPVRGYMWRE